MSSGFCCIQINFSRAEKVLSQKSSLEDFNKENSKIPNDFQSTEVITAYEYVCKDVDKAFRATPMLKEKYDRNDLRPNKYFDVADKNGNFPIYKYTRDSIASTDIVEKK